MYSVMIGTTDYKGYKGKQLGAVFAGAFEQWNFVQLEQLSDVQCNDWDYDI